MVQILNSDWSRENLLRSDWLGLIGAPYTTQEPFGNEELTHYHMKGHAKSQQILVKLLVLTFGRTSKFIPPPWYKGGGGVNGTSPWSF